MPRRKVSMGLIPNRRLRANTFAKRKEGLKKKARELSTLCGVRVALVCAADGAADVWESAAGVLDAYRDLPAEERARHTHRTYADLELRKAETKLVKVRQEGPAALAPWDAALYALTLDEAHRLLGAVDETVRAVNERRAALGLPVDDNDDGNSWFKAFAAPGASDAFALLGLPAPSSTFVGSNLSSIDGYLLRAQGNNAIEQVTWGGGFDPCSAATNWQPGYAFQQQCAAGSCPDMDVYKLQTMAAVDMHGNNGNSMGRLSWDESYSHPATDAVVTQPGYGFERTDGTRSSYYAGTPSYHLTRQVPSNAVIPPGYYPSLEMGLNYYMDAPAAQQEGIGGGNFNAAAALSLTMGTGDNLVNARQAQPLAMSYNTGDLVNAGDYASQWAAGPQPAIQQRSAALWEAL